MQSLLSHTLYESQLTDFLVLRDFLLIDSVHKILILWDLPFGKDRNLVGHSTITLKSWVESCSGASLHSASVVLKVWPRNPWGSWNHFQIFHMKIPRHYLPFSLSFFYNSFPEGSWCMIDWMQKQIWESSQQSFSIKTFIREISKMLINAILLTKFFVLANTVIFHRKYVIYVNLWWVYQCCC